MRILIVEDKDAKFAAIVAAARAVSSDHIIERAHTVVEAERLVRLGPWDLLLLDISMDISGTSRGMFGGGHANLGGLDIVETMFYEGLTIPTLVITGFDYFIASTVGESTEYIGLVELDQRVRAKMPTGYLGCVRYGSEDWSQRVIDACQERN
jgi:CheY-like chemotaxis protein